MCQTTMGLFKYLNWQITFSLIVHLYVHIFTQLISSHRNEVFNSKALYMKLLHIIEFVIDFIHN